MQKRFDRLCRNYFSGVAMLFLLCGPVGAVSVASNLTVNTEVPHSCQVVSPDENLVLTVDRTQPLTNLRQPLSNIVEIQINCSGRPRLVDVSFSPGLASLDDHTNFRGIRGLKRANGRVGEPRDVLGYRLYASYERNFSANDDEMDPDCNWIRVSNGHERLRLDREGSITIYVRAKVYEGDNARAFVSSQDVPAGNYLDQVVLTINY